jgi:hypothetical protein
MCVALENAEVDGVSVACKPWQRPYLLNRSTVLAESFSESLFGDGLQAQEVWKRKLSSVMTVF